MKGPVDKKTGDVPDQTSRQARYDAKRREAGYRRVAIWIKETDYLDGQQAAQRGLGPDVPGGMDPVSWSLGYQRAADQVGHKKD